MTYTRFLLFSFILAHQPLFGMQALIKKPNESAQDKILRETLTFKAYKDANMYGTLSNYFYFASFWEQSETPNIHLSKAIEQQNVLQCILHFAHGRSLTQVSKHNKSTLLHIAAHNGNYPVCLFLLDTGRFKNVHTLNKQGLTAQGYASLNGHHGIARMLMKYQASLPYNDECDLDTTLQQFLESTLSSTSIMSFYELLHRDSPREFVCARDRLFTHAFNNTPIKKLFERIPSLLNFIGCTQFSAFDAKVSEYIATLECTDPLSSLKFAKLAAIYDAYMAYHGAITLSLIHKKKENEVFSKIPKDVIKFVIIPFIRPLKYNKPHNSVANQIDILNMLLARHPQKDKLVIENVNEKIVKITNELINHFQKPNAT